MSLEDRFAQLVQHLGIPRAHVAGGYAADAVTLARAFPEWIASMTLVCPFRLPPEPFQAFGDRVLLIGGDRGPGADSVPHALASLPTARSLTLKNYADAAWSDAIADRRAEIESVLLPFLAEAVAQRGRWLGLDRRAGQRAGSQADQRAGQP